MRSARLRFALILLALLATGLGCAAPAQHVIIVSLDGCRPDVILTSDTPNIHDMADHGAFTWYAQTIMPSVTLPAHSSMLSGCLPAKHGMTWNDKFRPEAGYIKTSTCFEIAKAAGMSTAMFVGKEKLKHIAKPGTVDKFELVEGGAIATCAAAAEYLKADKPSLLFVHDQDPDTVGHAFGWGSPQQHKAVENCDKGLGILRQAVQAAGIADSTIFIITADHGGHLKNHGSTDPRDMTIPWVCYGPGIVKSGEVQGSVWTCDTAATAVYALGLKADSQWDGKAVTEVFGAVKETATAK